MSGPAWITEFSQDSHYTYPHLNGAATASAARGAGVVVASRTPRRDASTLVWIDLGTGEERTLCTLRHRVGEHNYLWWDMDPAGTRLVTVADGAVHLVDLTTGSTVAERIYEAPPGQRLSVISSLHPSGRKCLASHYPTGSTGGPSTIIELDLRSGIATTLLRSELWLAHPQYCEADPEWIGFANQSRSDHLFGPYARVWALHPESAPLGRQLWQQQPPGGLVPASHEVWRFDRTGCIVVAPTVHSEARLDTPGPKGLWSLDVDGRPAELVAAGEMFNHCTINRVGDLAAVDVGPDENWRGNISLISMDGRFPPRQVASLGWQQEHPCHGHPGFSPDGRHLMFTDTETQTGRTRVGVVDVAAETSDIVDDEEQSRPGSVGGSHRGVMALVAPGRGKE